MKKSFFNRETGVLLLLLFLLLGMTVLSLLLGSVPLDFAQLVQVAGGDHDSLAGRILLDVRLPRTLTALFSGASLAVAGAILQGIMRNPLAEPGLIGISPGAGLAAALVLLVFPRYSAFMLVPGAFAGALAAAVLVCLLAWDRGITPVCLILAGVAAGSMLSAITSMIFLFHSERLAGVMDFVIGSLSGRSWEMLLPVLPYMLAALVWAFLAAGKLNILSLGDESAAGLGLRVERERVLLLICASLLAASAVSIAGMLGFLGLIAPHIVRLIMGSDHRYLLPGSALFGASLLIGCDLAARLLLAPRELPAGALLALLGPPFFLYLLRTRRIYES